MHVPEGRFPPLPHRGRHPDHQRQAHRVQGRRPPRVRRRTGPRHHRAGHDPMTWSSASATTSTPSAPRTTRTRKRCTNWCDEIIYLIDEANLEAHGSWSLPGDVLTEDTIVPGSKREWEGACVDRVNSMMRRDYNHPKRADSVIGQKLNPTWATCSAPCTSTCTTSTRTVRCTTRA